MNLKLLNPRTRLQKLAYYLIQGNSPSDAARLAGYAQTTVATNAHRLAKGLKVQHLIKVYQQRLGLLSEDTLQEGLNYLRARVNSSKPREALSAITTIIKLAHYETHNPYRTDNPTCLTNH